MKLDAFIARIFLVIVSTILAFLVLEFVSRCFFSHRPPFERRFPVQEVRYPRPYTMFGGKPGGKNLNRQGYRGKSPVMPKASEEFRAFMLGGSTVFNGCPSIPELVEDEFTRNGFSSVSVYNFGVVSSVSSQELARIVFEISELQPDLVIMYNGGNDILHPWFWDPRPGYPFNFAAYENNPLLESDIKSYPTMTLVAYGSNIFRYLFADYFVKRFVPLQKLRDEVHWKSDKWREAVASVYVGNLEKAYKICRSFEAQFVAFFQPLVYFKKDLSPEEREMCSDIAKKEYAIDMRERVRRQIEQTMETSSLRSFDLSDAYDGISECVFKDSMHTHQQSKSVIAKKIYNKIVEVYEVKR